MQKASGCEGQDFPDKVKSLFKRETSLDTNSLSLTEENENSEYGTQFKVLPHIFPPYWQWPLCEQQNLLFVHRTEKPTSIRTPPVSTYPSQDKQIHQSGKRCNNQNHSPAPLLSELVPIICLLIFKCKSLRLASAQSRTHTPPAVSQPGEAQPVFLK